MMVTAPYRTLSCQGRLARVVCASMSRIVLPLFLAASIIAGLVVQTGAQTGAQSAQSATQGGDQFLDGIGETSLIARYVFNGNAEDSSRNQLHATVRGTSGV